MVRVMSRQGEDREAEKGYSQFNETPEKMQRKLQPIISGHLHHTHCM